MTPDDIDHATLPPPLATLDDLFPVLPYPCHPPGQDLMLRLIAYDIAAPKRWRRICDACADHGVRVQYSLFECWLEDSAFKELWSKLEKIIDPDEDRLVAYTLDATAVRKRQTAGDTMKCTEKANYYVV